MFLDELARPQGPLPRRGSSWSTCSPASRRTSSCSPAGSTPTGCSRILDALSRPTTSTSGSCAGRSQMVEPTCASCSLERRRRRRTRPHRAVPRRARCRARPRCARRRTTDAAQRSVTITLDGRRSDVRAAPDDGPASSRRRSRCAPTRRSPARAASAAPAAPSSSRAGRDGRQLRARARRDRARLRADLPVAPDVGRRSSSTSTPDLRAKHTAAAPTDPTAL